MKRQNLATKSPKSNRLAGFLGLALLFGVLLAAVSLFLLPGGRRDTVRVTTGPSQIDQAALDGPGWTPRPTKPRVVPSDLSGMDAATEGILRYIQVHDDIPDYIILEYYKSKFNIPY